MLLAAILGIVPVCRRVSIGTTSLLPQFAAAYPTRFLSEQWPHARTKSTSPADGLAIAVDDVNRELSELFGEPLTKTQNGSATNHLQAGPRTAPFHDAHSDFRAPHPAGLSAWPQPAPLEQEVPHHPASPPEAKLTHVDEAGRAATLDVSQARQEVAAQPTDGGRLTHVDEAGRASMVDVSQKTPTARQASASVRVMLGRHAFDLVAANRVAKGDVLATARLAGVMAAKQTPAVIPLCHNITLSHVGVEAELDSEACAVNIRATASTVGTTGVEMEALMAAAGAALTVYDMCKAVTKAAVITDLRLEHKSGGKSGPWARPHQ